MTWRPNSPVDTARARADMLGTARAFFAARDVLEVSTPGLASRTSTDPNVESIVARVSDQQRYLQTSPEHFMKRLLAADYPDIYQICSVYRDGESGRHHLPEFTMLEWYRRDLELQGIIEETITLTSTLLSNTKPGQPPLLVSYSDAFEKVLDLDPLSASIDTLARSADADPQLVKSLGDDRDAWLDLLMAGRVAPSFAAKELTAVYHYPASQAALARICPQDSKVADRFELYFGEVELANGFVELTDATEQRNRFRSDQEKRRLSGHEYREVDEALLEALKAGLPQSAGVALGIDRLLMINEGQDDIRAVVTFAPGS